MRDRESEALRGHNACRQQVGARPGITDRGSVKTLLLPFLKGIAGVELLGHLPRHLSLCLVSMKAQAPEMADVG